MNIRQLFLQHVAQTSDAPLMLEIVSASGVYLYGKNNEKYLDLISGISVSNVGHCHPNVVTAIQKQAETFMHLMVYGEYVYSPQVKLANTLTALLPSHLDNVYFTNSGTEATEGALKLAKRYTGRTEIVHFKNSYHGSTQGALSVMGDEYFKQAFRPLIPGNRMLEYGNETQLDQITSNTAAVILEPIQAESGITIPSKSFIKKLREKCTEVGALLIVDEIQTGMGRTGTLFAFEQFEMVPDILLLAKGLGGGMPIGAFIANKNVMETLTNNPVLGHITTFGGNAVCCAAAQAVIDTILEEKLLETVEAKGQLFETLLSEAKTHYAKLNRIGLMMSLEFPNFETNKKIIDACISNGVITDWFLFAPNKLRICPPLTISEAEIEEACTIINTVLKTV